MPQQSSHIEHHPIIGAPSHHAEERAVVVFDTATGRRIGHSPHVLVEQTSRRRNKDGSVTTTLKLTPRKQTAADDSDDAA
jgi:hypothetical protein